MNHNLERLNKIGFFEIKPGLERILKVLMHLDNPHNKFRSVIIAGTNGKGSVASILSSVLISNGYKTGLYTSPHLISITERIKFNNYNISKNNLDHFLGKVFNACDEIEVTLSYFELLTAASFLYFSNEKVDIAVLEVGMGGRWDATNVVNPLVSVITNISYDHSEHLGNTLELIAGEKSEIIKANRPVVSGVAGEETTVIQEKAASVNSNLYTFGVNFKFETIENNKFNYLGINSKLENLSTNLGGKHQFINSSLALATAELLNEEYGYELTPENIVKALLSVDHQGRFEIIRNNPLMVLDAAHNTSAATSLVNTLKEFNENEVIFLVSMLSDKNHKEFISVLSEVAKKIVITKIPNERAIETNNLSEITKNFMDDLIIIENYKEAFEYVKTLKETVCVTGSVYLIGLIKEILKQKEIK